MSKKTRISSNDIALFRAHVADVKPLNHSRKATLKQAPPPPKPLPVTDDEADDESLIVFNRADEQISIGSEDSVLYVRPGIPDRVIKRLRRGQLTLEASLDLHGNTVKQAQQQLADCLKHCKHHDIRHLLIIHGKSARQHQAPVLKNKVNTWLRAHPQVLAFCSAKRHHGGNGAVYVLLRAS